MTNQTSSPPATDSFEQILELGDLVAASVMTGRYSKRSALRVGHIEKFHDSGRITIRLIKGGATTVQDGTNLVVITGIKANPDRIK